MFKHIKSPVFRTTVRSSHSQTCLGNEGFYARFDTVTFFFVFVSFPHHLLFNFFRFLLFQQYPNMLCVEAGYVNKPFVLEPGKKFEAQQTFSCSCV